MRARRVTVAKQVRSMVHAVLEDLAEDGYLSDVADVPSDLKKWADELVANVESGAVDDGTPFCWQEGAQ